MKEKVRNFVLLHNSVAFQLIMDQKLATEFCLEIISLQHVDIDTKTTLFMDRKCYS